VLLVVYGMGPWRLGVGISWLAQLGDGETDAGFSSNRVVALFVDAFKSPALK
jgi:hypothetical protein